MHALAQMGLSGPRQSRAAQVLDPAAVVARSAARLVRVSLRVVR